MFRKISIIIGIILCIIDISLMFIHNGFELEYNAGMAKSSPVFTSGGTAYGWLAQVYFQLLVCYVFYLVGEYIKNKTLSGIICILALLLTFFPFRNLYLQKSVYFNDVESFSRLIRETIILDWLCVFLVLFLLIYQIIITFQYLFRESPETT